MSCKNTCSLCRRLILSQSVTFTSGTLTVNLPAGTYNNGEKYCIVIAQAVPSTATINAPVVITIGAGSDTYPLLTSCCSQATASDIRSRTKYATRLVTSASGASFRMLGCTSRGCAATVPESVDGGTQTPAAGDANTAVVQTVKAVRGE